nr:hypothetical protein [Streptomyces canus]
MRPDRPGSGWQALTAAGVRCVVVALAKVEGPPGDRVKTGRRDAERPVRLLQEAARDLVRAREDVRGDLMRARHRLSALLLRHGLVWQGTAWTQEHEGWLRSLSFDRLGVQLAFEEAFDTVLSTHARRGRLDGAIEQMAASSAFAPVVGRLGCLRGVSTLTAFGLAVEVGDWHRFTGATTGSSSGTGAVGGLRRRAPSAGSDHQDRHQPCPRAAGGGVLAPPQAVPSWPRADAPPGQSAARGPGPCRPGQPARASTVEAIRRP